MKKKKYRIMKKKRYKLKSLSKDKLRLSEGKVATEELFIRDNRLAILFVKYMLKNIKYLKKYEYEPITYDGMIFDLENMLKCLKKIDKDFKEHNREKSDDGAES